jgi:hypothetical protein
MLVLRAWYAPGLRAKLLGLERKGTYSFMKRLRGQANAT